jgi:hypothetical protein
LSTPVLESGLHQELLFEIDHETLLVAKVHELWFRAMKFQGSAYLKSFDLQETQQEYCLTKSKMMLASELEVAQDG